MTTLRVGNNRTEEMVGDLSALSPVERRFAGCGAHRLVWFAEEGDVLVLPSPPEDGFLEYATALTGTPLSSLRLVVPAPGVLGPDLLTPDRLADPALHEELRRALGGRPPERVLAMTPNASVVALAEALGNEAAVPGHGFHRQNGAALVNSKAVFRAVAAGTGVPLAPGAVVTGQAEAAGEIARLLGRGHCAMLKLEFQAGGFGNEILSPDEGVRAIGAQRVVVLPDSAAVEKYLTRRWDWLTGGRGHRLVVERYYPDSVPVYAEFEVTDDGCALVGHGEMLMAPVVVGEMVPAPALSAAEQGALVAAGRRLCEPFRAMGYRGNLSADAFLTPDREVLFSETNGRITGSTHVHTAVGARLVGEERRASRVYLERGGWAVPSFRAAVERLAGSGLAFDRESATGAVLICGFGPADGTVRYCVAAEDIESARERERELLGLFPR